MPRLSRVVLGASLAAAVGCNKQPQTETAAAPQPAAPAATAPAVQPQTAATANGAQKKTITQEQASQLIDQLIGAGRFRDAVPLINQLLTANPKNKDAWVKRAAILANSKLLTQAIADMGKAIEIDPANAKFHNTRGYFHLQQHELDEALADFDQAISLDSKFSQPHNNRALVKVAQEKWAEAVQECDSALAIDGQYLDAYNNKGFAQMRLEQYEPAVKSFSQAIEINPKYVNAWNNRAHAYLKANQPEKALTDFNESIRLSSGVAGYYLGRADAYAAMGKTAEAQADKDHVAWIQTLAGLTQEALKNPQKASNWIERGRHLLLRQDATAALADFNRALQISAESVDARCGHAASLILLGKYDEAISDCNIVLAKDLQLSAISVRGDAYFKKGDLDRALEDYATARRRDAQVAEVYRMRAEKRRGAGDAAGAEADLQEALALEPSTQTIQQASAEAPAAN
jgi:tetratricopeptide (TPR) repeat protein